MSYSYKPVLIKALLKMSDANGVALLKNITKYFREYYSNRKNKGLIVERNKCIYLNDYISDKDISDNILKNPMKAFVISKIITYNHSSKEIQFASSLWEKLNYKEKQELERICNERLFSYFNKNSL